MTVFYSSHAYRLGFASSLKRHLQSKSGVALVASAAVLGVMSASMSPSVKELVSTKAVASSVSRSLSPADVADQFVRDFKTVDPTSIIWAALAPTSPSSITGIAASTFPTYATDGPGTIQPGAHIQYRFVPSGNGLGSIVRLYNESSETLIQNVVSPTVACPLIQQDISTFNKVILTFRYFPTGAHQPVLIARSVTVTG